MNALIELLKANLIEYKTDFLLADRSSVRIGGKADVAVFPKSESELLSVLESARSNKIQTAVVGALSNILVPDAGFAGAVIFTDLLNGYSVKTDTVEISCGVRLSRILDELSSLGISGFEPFYGIPGFVGGLVYNNAGAFSAEISDIFLSARIYDTESGKIKLFNLADMEFSYRNSVLRKNKNLVLLSAEFSYTHSDKQSILSAVRAYADKRRASQPLNFPSLGSVFKRPSIGFAGAYVEDAGLKGFAIGGARISEKHAGFVINTGGATAHDFISVIEHAEKNVLVKYGIKLEREIELLEQKYVVFESGEE